MRKNIFRLMALLLLVATASCVPSRKIQYLQGSEALIENPQPIVQNYELTIKPDDRIMVNVSSRDRELLDPFSNSQMLGTSTSSSSTSAQGTVVAKDGTVNLPIIGKVKVAGMKRAEAEQYIQQFLADGEYVKDPVVNITFLNLKVSVIGAVGNPGEIAITGERLSIIDAISAAGDLLPSGRRQNVKVYREENGERRAYEIDLTDSKAVFDSPCFYLQQNDVVYVEYNKVLNLQGSAFMTYLGAGASIISVIASLLSLAFVVAK